MLRAVEHIRRMRGGAQAHLMRCKQDSSPEEDFFYIVKFQNNPQHPRHLANEMLGTALAARLGLSTAPREVIEAGPHLIQLTSQLVRQLGLARTSWRPGRQSG